MEGLCRQGACRDRGVCRASVWVQVLSVLVGFIDLAPLVQTLLHPHHIGGTTPWPMAQQTDKLYHVVSAERKKENI